jgi:type IV secretory pathway VirB4 component
MPVKSKAAQDFVPVEDVHDGVIILKDKTMRMILMTSTINFALKSAEEQAGILLQFQNFLNSLEFSTQIYIQSRRMDIKPYLALLRSRLKEDVSELMRIQIEEYIGFIQNFTDTTDIMTKNFFVVIPYSGRVSNVPGEESKNEEASLEKFEEGRTQLEQRAHIIKQGLVRVGIRVVPLGTEEVIELYYRIFNPSDEVGKPLKV